MPRSIIRCRVRVGKLLWIPADVILPSISQTVRARTEGGIELAYWDGAVWRSHYTGARLMARVTRWNWL